MEKDKFRIKLLDLCMEPDVIDNRYKLVYFVKTIRIVLERCPKRIRRKKHWKTLKKYCDWVFHAPLDRDTGGCFLDKLKKIRRCYVGLRLPHCLGKIKACIIGNAMSKHSRAHYDLMQLPGLKDSFDYFSDVLAIERLKDSIFFDNFKREFQKEVVDHFVDIPGMQKFAYLDCGDDIWGCITEDSAGLQTKQYFFRPKGE